MGGRRLGQGGVGGSERTPGVVTVVDGRTGKVGRPTDVARVDGIAQKAPQGLVDRVEPGIEQQWGSAILQASGMARCTILGWKL